MELLVKLLPDFIKALEILERTRIVTCGDFRRFTINSDPNCVCNFFSFTDSDENTVKITYQTNEDGSVKQITAMSRFRWEGTEFSEHRFTIDYGNILKSCRNVLFLWNENGDLDYVNVKTGKGIIIYEKDRKWHANGDVNVKYPISLIDGNEIPLLRIKSGNKQIPIEWKISSQTTAAELIRSSRVNEFFQSLNDFYESYYQS